MSSGWPMRPSGASASIVLLEVAADEAGGMGAFAFHHAGIDGIDADLARAQFRSQNLGDGIHRALGAGIDGGAGNAHAADDGRDVDDAAAVRPEQGQGFARGRQQAPDIDVELAVEFGFGGLARSARN